MDDNKNKDGMPEEPVKKERKRVVSKKSTDVEAAPVPAAEESVDIKATRKIKTVPETSSEEHEPEDISDTIMTPAVTEEEISEDAQPEDLAATIMAPAVTEEMISEEPKTGKKGKTRIRRKKKNKRQAKAKRPLWKRILLTALVVFLILGFLGGIAGVGVILKWMSEAPPLDTAKLVYKDASVIMDINDEYYQELQTSEKRENVTIQEVPELVQLAFVSIEDQRFYSHFGVDIRGTVKAVIGVLTSGSTEGMGGSTITQQLIKQTHLSSETSIKRKAKEWKLAYELEQQFTKRQVLQSYLNKINLSYAWGVQSASEMYFGLDVSELDVAQAATLASIMKAPTYYNPYSYVEDEEGNSRLERITDENGNTVIVQGQPSKDRAKTVIVKMYELGHISEKEMRIALNEIDSNGIGLVAPHWNTDYTYFTDAVYTEVLEDLQEKYSMTYDDAVDLMLNGGITIYSTVDPDVQNALEANAADDDLFPSQSYTAENASKAVSEQTGSEVNYIPQIGGAVIEVKTGYVVGIIGGRDKEGSLTMNRALQHFQTGSSTKPCTAYSPGIDTGTITLGTTFDSIPLSFGGYRPSNFIGEYNGLTTVRQGLLESNNLIALQSEYLTGHELCAAYAEKFGYEIVWEDEADLNGSALALGGYTYGQMPLTMASAFSTFPNQGKRVTPTFYRYVKDSDGNIILESEQETVEVIRPQTAWLVTDVLKGIADPVNGNQAAGKTGTTDSQTAVWYCGFTRDYAAAFWIGYDVQNVYVNGEEYNLRIGTASSVARNFWNHVMRDFYEVKGIWGTYLPGQPDGIVSATIDTVSGRIPSDLSALDPREGGTIRSEYFIAGTQPGEVDTYHREILICTDTGLMATEFCPHVEKRVMVYKDPELVYIAGGYPYRDDFKYGKTEVEAGVAIPDNFCAEHNIDTKIVDLALGTAPNDVSSILNTALTIESGKETVLYVYGIPATNNVRYLEGIDPVVTSSDPEAASVSWNGTGIEVKANGAGAANVTVSITFNPGIVSGVKGVPDAAGTGEIIYPEYTASTGIMINVTLPHGGDPVDPPVDPPTPPEEEDPVTPPETGDN